MGINLKIQVSHNLLTDYNGDQKLLKILGKFYLNEKVMFVLLVVFQVLFNYLVGFNITSFSLTILSLIIVLVALPLLIVYMFMLKQ